MNNKLESMLKIKTVPVLYTIDKKMLFTNMIILIPCAIYIFNLKLKNL